MGKVTQLDAFRALSEGVGRFDIHGKTCLLPEMNRIGSHLLAAVFRGFGINTFVMDTYDGLDMGKEYTSGKECFPCVVTLGDVLLYMEKEKERLGNAFNSGDYVYFMPETNGPCRFGMYNKYHRIVLDSVPGLEKLKIVSLSSEDSYSMDGLLSKEKVKDFRKMAYLSLIAGDILDRFLWRTRPYEKEEGMADRFIDAATVRMTKSFSVHSAGKNTAAILNDLQKIIAEGKNIIDTRIPKKPLIGVIGEIYVRSHTESNQDTIRTLEKYGAEAVNASIGEWVNYTAYERARSAGVTLKYNLKKFRFKEAKEYLVNYLKYSLTLFYQYLQQEKAYKMARKHVDIREDHKIGHLEKILKNNNTFSFELGTEACLSISCALDQSCSGYNGIVNVFPFTCMPSNLTSAIAKPLMAKLNMPYIDISYDGSYQPGRESAIRTFMYQAHQHFNTNGRS
jgi:predicted nucleotide-binding protein (sugar kinase/HSP70/actin superfamily)